MHSMLITITKKERKSKCTSVFLVSQTKHKMNKTDKKIKHNHAYITFWKNCTNLFANGITWLTCPIRIEIKFKIWTWKNILRKYQLKLTNGSNLERKLRFILLSKCVCSCKPSLNSRYLLQKENLRQCLKKGYPSGCRYRTI